MLLNESQGFFKDVFISYILEMVEITTLKCLSNIKDKYNLVRVISNLAFLTMFVFLFIVIETEE